MSSIQQIVFGLACCVFGGFFSRFALRTWRRGRESSSWLKVPGRIHSSSVVVTEGSYSPHVVYSYDVEGISYQNSRVSLALTTYPLHRQAEAIAHRYQPGQQILVFVDPANHRAALLDPGLNDLFALLFIIASLLVVSLGIFLIFKSILNL
jgi:hypothetical protein